MVVGGDRRPWSVLSMVSRGKTENPKRGSFNVNLRCSVNCL